MPIFVEWQWQENTKTFLVIFHFWDDGQKTNLRMRIEEEGFETVADIYPDEEEKGEGEFVPIITLPHAIRDYPRTNTYLSWAPSHPEFCFLTEVLTYANLINGMKPNHKRKLRLKLEGKIIKREEKGYEYFDFDVHRELFNSMPQGTMVSFAGQKGISFEVRLEYLEYLRKIVKPFLRN